MEYRVFSDKVIVRVDRGEEICEQLKAVCEKEGIVLASVSAIGAVGDFTVGVFSPDRTTYKSTNFMGDYEIGSRSGLVTEMDGKCYSHLPMSVADGDGRVFGGHLNRAVVSATCEMVITVSEGRIDRKFSQDIGLNLLEF